MTLSRPVTVTVAGASVALLVGACGSTAPTARTTKVLGRAIERPAVTTTPAAVDRPSSASAGGESLAPGEYREAADNDPTLHYDPTRLPGVAESSTVMERGTERLRFDVELRSAGVDGVRVVVDLRNTSGRTIRTDGGVSVVVHVRGNGAPWRDVTLHDPATSLAPDARCELEQLVPGAEPGDYAATAETVVRLI